MKKFFALMLVLVAFAVSACHTYKVCPTYAKKSQNQTSQQ